MSIRTTTLTALATALLVATVPVQAQTVTVNETSHIRYDTAGAAVTNGNYITGLSGNQMVYDTGFVFSTAGAQRASAISITFNAAGTFRTDAASETLGLFDFTGNIATLGTASTANYTDLSGGTSLGSYTLTAANNTAMPSFTVQLGQSFVDQYNASISAADQRVALGAALTTVTGTTPSQSFWFGSGGGTASFLSVQVAAVPEPAAWTLMIAGFGAVGGALRRRRRTVAGGLASA